MAIRHFRNTYNSVRDSACAQILQNLHALADYATIIMNVDVSNQISNFT